MDREMLERGCTCHLSPPCTFCTEMTEEEFEAYESGGRDALEKLIDTRELSS